MTHSSSRSVYRTAKPLSRKVAVACSVLLPLPSGGLADPMQDATVTALLERSELQAQLFNAGDMERWVEVAGIGKDFSLMQPFGGDASRGFDPSPKALAYLAANFRNGDATVEPVQAIVSDDIVVLAYVERQTGEVHGLPMQDWSLRVTQVFLRQGEEWKLVHRHADPLVRPLSLELTAAIAAGRPLVETDGATE